MRAWKSPAIDASLLNTINIRAFEGSSRKRVTVIHHSFFFVRWLWYAGHRIPASSEPRINSIISGVFVTKWNYASALVCTAAPYRFSVRTSSSLTVFFFHYSTNGKHNDARWRLKCHRNGRHNRICSKKQLFSEALIWIDSLMENGKVYTKITHPPSTLLPILSRSF